MAKSADVELARVITRASIIKTAIICVTITVGLLILCITAYRMMKEPPWLVVVLAVIGSIGGPSGCLAIVLRLRSRYIAKHHQDRVELEKIVDPTRKSSKP